MTKKSAAVVLSMASRGCPVTSNRIEVQVSGTYLCTGFNEFPNIQLGSEDAQKLFPGPFQKLQEAIAVGLN